MFIKFVVVFFKNVAKLLLVGENYCDFGSEHVQILFVFCKNKNESLPGNQFDGFARKFLSILKKYI